MTPRAPILTASVFLPFALAACVSSPDDVDDTRRHRRQWESQRIASYRVQSRLICFCITEATAPVVLQVRDRRLVSVTRVSDGAAVPPSDWPLRYYTVDQMFDLIEESQRQGAAEVRVTYDPQLGYPTEVYLDPRATVADDERQFEYASLAPLS